MTGYGPPPGPPPAARAGGSPLPVFDLVGAGLGVLAFILGFLPWAGPDGVDTSVKGYELPLPTASTALLMVAAALLIIPLLNKPAVGAAPAKTDASPLPALLAVIALLLDIAWLAAGRSFGGVDLKAKVGGYLGLVVALAAAGVLLFSWLQATGKVGGASQQPNAWGQPGAPGGWQQPPPAPGYGQQPPAPGYGQGGPTPPPGYPPQGPPSGGYPQQPPPGYPPQG